MKESVNSMTDQAVKKEILPEGIYIEAKPVGDVGSIGDVHINAYHAYLVYRDGKGHAEVIRGGPETMAENEKAEGIKGIEAFIYSTVGGDIEIEAGTPLTESVDRYDEEDSPQSRFAKRLDLGGRSPQKVWEDMKITAQTIGKNETDYNLFSQKCNSTIATIGLDDQRIC